MNYELTDALLRVGAVGAVYLTAFLVGEARRRLAVGRWR